MNLELSRRAEVALRSLGEIEKRHFRRTFAELETVQPTDLSRHRKVHLLRLPDPGREKLYIVKATPRLRAIMSIKENTYLIEDIVDHDRLTQLSYFRELP